MLATYINTKTGHEVCMDGKTRKEIEGRFKKLVKLNELDTKYWILQQVERNEKKVLTTN